MKTLTYKKASLIGMLIMLNSICLLGQNYFRSGLFLHHSTGNYIWGPNPDGTSTTTIDEQMHWYNVNHGFFANDSISMSHTWWDPPGENHWYLLRMFLEGDTVFSGTWEINNVLINNKILVIKSCYPSSDMMAWGDPYDTLYPDWRTVYNYKNHWRHMARAMQHHPQNFFAIWTNTPMCSLVTTPQAAALSRSFCIWAKDTLAAGLDPEFGPFPKNIYVFDYFRKITDVNGFEQMQYVYMIDSVHPNGAATNLVAPQFINEIFNAALVYEALVGVETLQKNDDITMSTAPNPFEAQTTINIHLSGTQLATLILLDITGRQLKTIWTGSQPGDHSIQLNGKDLAPGMYYLKLIQGHSQKTLPLVYL
jgi:hypothetical protein